MPLITGMQAALALGLAVAYGLGAFGGPIVAVPLGSSLTEHIPILGVVTIYYDGLTSLMLALVSFVGWVISS